MSVNPINNRINNVTVPIVLASSEMSCNFLSLKFTTRVQIVSIYHVKLGM
jgi:hypothetical protein